MEDTKTGEKKDCSLLQLGASLVPIFHKLLECVGLNIFVFVDGLDECTDYAELIDALRSLLDKPSLHLMFTSRPDVHHRLHESTKYSIEVGANQTQAEIRKYVTARIKHVKRFSSHMRKRACERIVNQSEGSFRYAEVIL